jgi:hypothetical protein
MGEKCREHVPNPAIFSRWFDKVVQELRGAKVSSQLEVYSGAGYDFSTSKNMVEERANAQSIASTERTLKELFGI